MMLMQTVIYSEQLLIFNVFAAKFIYMYINIYAY